MKFNRFEDMHIKDIGKNYDNREVWIAYDFEFSFLQFVPDGLKDEKYWARRRKNNMAAKRSRDARRLKENQIALRAGFLEKEVRIYTYEPSCVGRFLDGQMRIWPLNVRRRVASRRVVFGRSI